MSIIETYRTRITTDAMALAEAREVNSELQPANAYIVEDITRNYELRLLRKELKTVQERIYGHEFLGQPVPPLVTAKLDIIQTRLTAMLGQPPKGEK